MAEQLYKLYHLVDGKWRCLTTGAGVPKETADFQRRMQQALRGGIIRVKPCKSKPRKGG